MQCSFCNLDKFETVTLWNGEEYCEECTGRVHKGLYTYAQQHETLNSNYRQFPFWRIVRDSIKSEALIGLICIGIFAAILTPAFLEMEANEWDKMGGFAGVILFASFMYVMVMLLRCWWKPIFVSQVIKQHPTISIADGEVTLSLSRAKNVVLPLSAVNLQILSLRDDTFFRPIAFGKKERYSMLDFSECVKEVQPGMTWAQKVLWRRSPYLCFTASPYENGILTAFFRLIGQTHAWLQDETFPTEEEQLPDTTVIADPRTSSWAIAAMYFGLFSVLVLPAPIALILGIIALRDCQQRSCKGRGRAIFAIIMGSLFLPILMFFIFIELMMLWM